MQKKLIAGIIAILVVVTAVLVFVNRKGDKNVSGLVLAGGGKEVLPAAAKRLPLPGKMSGDKLLKATL